ncbi:MAG: DUF2877 domain-containing protein, partial [Planctomycetaceae bacterium]|nr:DUF2877 domain-containing protein [Planctomycetaceae bacterium]
MMPDRPVLRIGSAGVTAAAMVQAGEPLTVAAVFERSFYCRDAADRWLCVLRDDLEPGPLHALAADWPARLGDRVLEGHTFAAAGRGVLATSTCVLDFRGYTPWHPPPFPPLRQELLRASLPRLRHAMREAAPPDTLAGVMVGRFHTDTQDDGWQQTVLAAVAHGVEKLTRWFASPGGDSLQDAVTALVGLGPGLTPTGDDILAGTALTLHAVGKT